MSPFARNCERYLSLAIKGQSSFSDLDKISGRVRAERTRLSLTQTEFARLGGVTLNTQHRYESGGFPSLEYLIRIGEAGADWYWIITGQRIETETLDSQSSDLVRLFGSLPPVVKQVALDQIRILADQLTQTQLDIIAAAPPPDASPRSAIHDKSQDYRHG